MTIIHFLQFGFAINVIVYVQTMTKLRMGPVHAFATVTAMASGMLMLAPLMGEIPNPQRALIAYFFAAFGSMLSSLALALYEQRRRNRTYSYVHLAMVFFNIVLATVSLTTAKFM